MAPVRANPTNEAPAEAPGPRAFSSSGGQQLPPPFTLPPAAQGRLPCCCQAATSRTYYYCALSLALTPAHPHPQVIREEESDAKAIVAFDEERVVMTFRGTASLKTACLDIRAAMVGCGGVVGTARREGASRGFVPPQHACWYI